MFLCKTDGFPRLCSRCGPRLDILIQTEAVETLNLASLNGQKFQKYQNALWCKSRSLGWQTPVRLTLESSGLRDVSLRSSDTQLGVKDAIDSKLDCRTELTDQVAAPGCMKRLQLMRLNAERSSLHSHAWLSKWATTLVERAVVAQPTPQGDQEHRRRWMLASPSL